MTKCIGDLQNTIPNNKMFNNFIFMIQKWRNAMKPSSESKEENTENRESSS